MSRRNRKPPPAAPVRATIESLAHAGRGVAHVNGKATFIDGALPGEEALFTYLMQRKRFDEGAVTEVITAAAVVSERFDGGADRRGGRRLAVTARHGSIPNA